MAEMLSLDRIATEGTQARVALSETVIREYAEALAEGDEFPPIDVYFDETTYWLADGFHRVAAAKTTGLVAMAATVHPGGQREALLHALGANETHGHRRTDADRRHAVELLLADSEWRAWSDREIARQCHVSHMLANRLRREIEPPEAKHARDETRKAKRGGTVYTMHTGRIGTSKRPASGEPEPTAPEPTESHVPVVEPASPEMSDASIETPSVTVLQIDSDASALEVSQAPTIMHVTPAHGEEEESPPVSVTPLQTDDAALPKPQEPAPAPSASLPAVESQTAETPMPAVPYPPSLMDAWHHADDAQRQAFVAAYRDELLLLLAAYDAPPKAHKSASRVHPRPPKQQPKRRQRIRTTQ